MTSRDSQTVILSRQAIVLVTAVGVGLLTLCYVLGVQVGKQSAALRHPLAKGAGEDLQELPASVAEQLKAFQNPAGLEQAQPIPDPEPKPEPESEPAAARTELPKAELEKAKPEKAKPEPAPKAVPAKNLPAPKATAEKDKKTEGAGRWSLQLVSTPDSGEAKRMAARARSAGFPTVTISENGLFKVRLTQPVTREVADATALKLKNRGYKPFAIRTP